jgi:hypothetical protein
MCWPPNSADHPRTSVQVRFSVEWFEHPIEFAIAREQLAERTTGERGPFRSEGLVQYFDLVLDPVV